MLLSFTKTHPKTAALFWLAGLFLLSLQAKAQVTVSLQYTEKNNATTVAAGWQYSMQLDYSISSTTGNASGVKAVINLPDYIVNAGNFVGTVHAPAANFVFDNTPGAKKNNHQFHRSCTLGFYGRVRSSANCKQWHDPQRNCSQYHG
ncbi:hypothetical protein [Spirosoma foliorum]|uniref:Uncharacterized protein n=1 Tax=Spirosoma foliorum TaxID=2710596 RepID=A0A7G5H022_9BACT|nr:hypothetical protein [Spirosoma foliorum]QMW04464.1 hypothetical protein H3H32_05850 [Spirosoma foliorum]